MLANMNCAQLEDIFVELGNENSSDKWAHEVIALTRKV